MFLSRRVEAAKQEVLSVTATFLETHADAELRISEICDSSELSSTVIYSYFGSREGLLDATYIYVYEKQKALFDLGIFNCLEANPHPPFRISNIPLPEGIATPFDFFDLNRKPRLRIYARSIASPKFSKLLLEAQRVHYLDLIGRIKESFTDSSLILEEDVLLETLGIADTILVAKAINETTAHPLDNMKWVELLDFMCNQRLYRS